MMIFTFEFIPAHVGAVAEDIGVQLHVLHGLIMFGKGLGWQGFGAAFTGMVPADKITFTVFWLVYPNFSHILQLMLIMLKVNELYWCANGKQSHRVGLKQTP